MSNDEDTFVIWADNALLLLGGFILICFLLIQTITVKPIDPKNENTSPEGVTVEIRWPDGMDADVDLWVQAPGDVAVGYSNKQGRVFNLLRDDLGHYDDGLGNLRYESAYTRGVPAGEYIVNIGSYRNADQFPITVQVKITVRLKDRVQQIGSTTVTLTKISQEITAMRFTLDTNHNLVPGSVNHLFKPLWTGAKP